MMCAGVGKARGLILESAGRTTGKATTETRERTPGPSQQGDGAEQCEGMKPRKEEQREGWSWGERKSAHHERRAWKGKRGGLHVSEVGKARRKSPNKVERLEEE